VKCYIWKSTALGGTETKELRKLDQIYCRCFGMGCWRRLGKIS